MRSFLVVILASLWLPCAAAAQCGQRDVSGRWNMTLGDSSSEVEMDLKQSGNRITGKAQTTISNNFDFEYGDNLTGTVSGDQIEFSVVHKSPRFTINESFKGTFTPDGHITGKAFIVSFDANIDLPWKSDRAMKCLFNSVTKLGVKHTGNAASATTPKPPWIIASPNNLALPFNVPVPPVTIAWDAGKDHPYAEVWVKADNQDEKKILEKGTGTLNVTAERGRNYVYILTDAGTVLATVNVRFPR